MVHSGGGNAWADEDAIFPLPQDSIALRAIMTARAMEAAVAATDLDWLVLRGALFYGPGTGFDDDWFARARAGKLRLPGTGEDYVTLVHIADMADATVAALSRWPARQSLIVADDAPSRWRDVFDYIATAVGGPPPMPGGPARFLSFRVSNRPAREALAWSSRYPSHRVGLAR